MIQLVLFKINLAGAIILNINILFKSFADGKKSEKEKESNE